MLRPASTSFSPGQKDESNTNTIFLALAEIPARAYLHATSCLDQKITQES